MLGSGHLISGLDVATGTFALMLFSAGAALVVLIVLARVMLRSAGQSSMTGALWVCGLVLGGGMFAYLLVDRFSVREQAADRRAIEARAAELTARALAPGSALGCLDALASVVVENACERPLLASPEAVAAAVAYVDARISLLAASAALAERDPRYQPAFERLRRGLEADRYGLVAHVLMTRGCNGADCAELRLLHDPTRVVANMKVRAFETSLGTHALAWQSNGANAAVAPVPPFTAPPPLTTTGAAPGAPVTSGGPGTAGSPKFDFPSASSIPAVSIMNAEPGTPPAAEPRSAAPPPKRAAGPPVRRHSAREAPPPHAPPPSPPSPPTQITPEPAPAPAARTVPDVHSNR